MFAIPISELIGHNISFGNESEVLLNIETFDETTNISNIKTALTDIDNINKYRPADFVNDNFKFLTLDLNNKYLLFKNFYNGNLKIIGNNWYFIDDINYTLENYENEAYTNNLNDFIKTEKLNYTSNNKTPVVNEKLITLKSTGANGTGSTLTVSDIIGKTELYNLNIENSITADTIINKRIIIKRFNIY